ncbi:hypothetical protein [Pseudomonas syringae]|uniref:hypothetical protein n=1 Tax=Pseudomonas syringae TaxID=317 RepID=UPI003F8605FF
MTDTTHNFRSEVIKLLQTKRTKRYDRKRTADALKESFIDRANRFTNETLKIFEPLEQYGINCTKLPIKVEHDFGEGKIPVELNKIIIMEDENEALIIEPFASKLSAAEPLRFRISSSAIGARTIVNNAPPFGEHLGWYMYVNEDDKSVNPQYQEMNSEAWMSIVKDYLLANSEE